MLPQLEPHEYYQRMFVQEAIALSWLYHPNIVNVIDLARDHDGQLITVMEFIDGVTLHELLESGALSPTMIIFLASEILSGVGYAHDLPPDRPARGLVHRDLSPDNVLLSWEGAVKVADFGLAKPRTQTRTSAARPHGKYGFMSPEQLGGWPLDGRSDLFSVGVMIWEMLTQERLFRKEGYTPARMERLFVTPPRPAVVRLVPPDLDRVVMKLLEREPEQRYPNASAARHALLKCVDAPGAAIRNEFVRLLATRFPSRAPRECSAPCDSAPSRASARPSIWSFARDATPSRPSTRSSIDATPSRPSTRSSIDTIVRAILAVLVACVVGLGIGLALAWLLPL
jgi:serine/threonine protein kinase